MIYIIGTSHDIQNHHIDVDDSKVTKYYNFLKQEIQGKSIFMVAEESSIESASQLSTNPGEKTELEMVVAELNKDAQTEIKHIHVDPDRTESKSLGIVRRENMLKILGLEQTKRTHKQEWIVNSLMAPHDCCREQIWMEKIKPFTHNDILFVCGFMHVETFHHLLTENGYQSLIQEIII